MVGKNFYRKRGSLEIMFPCFQASYDCKEFPVIDVVVSFGRGEGLQEVRAGVPLSI